MKYHLKQIAIFAFNISTTFGIVACSSNPVGVEDSMKGISAAYKKANDSQSIVAMKPHIAALREHVKTAQKIQFTDPTKAIDYAEGMKTLNAHLDELDNAIAANNLVAAKEVLENKLKATRNKYHWKLGTLGI